MNRFVGLFVAVVLLAAPLSVHALTLKKGEVIGSDGNPKLLQQDSNSDGITVFKGRKYELPKDLNHQVNDATLYYYHVLTRGLRHDVYRNYVVAPSDTPYEFEFATENNSVIDEQLRSTSLLSYLYFEDGFVVYDAVAPVNRFAGPINDGTYFPSHSMGKSITSYLLGHAICEGYIASINAPIDKWPLMEDTLYFDQPLLNLLNMMAGDTHIIPSKSLAFKKTGRSIHGKAPLLKAAKDPDELWKSKPQKKPQFAYSNLTSDVLFNYIMHRVGNDFDDFISNFYQKKIRIAHPVYLWMNPLSPRSIPNTTENRILQGAGQYGISATRYDFLRIAKAMMDDWKNQTCEGTYLREIYDNSVRTNKRDTWNMTLADKGRMLGFQRVAKGYAGQFWVNIQSMDDDVVFVMSGADGQQIAINMSKSRIVAFAAGQEEFYDTKTLGMETLKFGRIKSSR